MEVYKLNNDHQYKDITGVEASVVSQFYDFRGQELGNNWTVPEFDLLEKVTRLSTERNGEKHKDLHFDIRCYGNILIVKSKYVDLFTHLNIEVLPVKIISLEEDFSFLNILTIIPSINFTNLDYTASMAMLKSDNINFNATEIGTNILFRDKKLINFYYCTDLFKKLIADNGLKGLTIKKVGIAS